MIGTYNESALHRQLKEFYAEGGSTEETIAEYVCDAVRPDGTLVEIQTRNLSRMKEKLAVLLPRYRLHLVHPIPLSTTIEVYDHSGTLLRRRKSPKKGNIYDLFKELTGIYPYLCHPHFSLEVVFVTQTEQREAVEKSRRNRRGMHTTGRSLETIGTSITLSSIEDYASLLPAFLSNEFTVKQLREAGAGQSAGKMAWVLRKMDIIEISGKEGKAFRYKKREERRGNDLFDLSNLTNTKRTDTINP
jgi:hypothetical protein